MYFSVTPLCRHRWGAARQLLISNQRRLLKPGSWISHTTLQLLRVSFPNCWRVAEMLSRCATTEDVTTRVQKHCLAACSSCSHNFFILVHADTSRHWADLDIKVPVLSLSGFSPYSFTASCSLFCANKRSARLQSPGRRESNSPRENTPPEEPEKN